MGLGGPVVEGAEWVPGVGEESMPGDSAEVSVFAGVLELRATELRDQADVIGRLEPDWQRNGADEFRSLKDTLPPRMGLVADRLEAVAAALRGYADELDGATVDAENAAGDARLAVQAWTTADTDRWMAVTGADVEGVTVADWMEDNPQHPDFETAIGTAEQDLEDAWDDYTAAYTRRHLAADACDAAITSAIDDASPTGTLNDAHPSYLAIEDAAELQRLLDELGIEVDSYEVIIGMGLSDIANPDSPYYELYQDLYAHLELMAGRTDDPGYALSLFNELGADGTYHAFGTIEALQASAPADLGWDIENDVLLPFLDGFAHATHQLDPAILDEILATGADEDHPERLGQLGLMIGANGSRYDAEFIAGATDIVLVSQAHRWSQPNAADDLLTSTQPIWDTLHLNSPHLAAYQALADNPQAAFTFAGYGDDNIAALVRPDEATAIAQTPSIAPSDVRDALAAASADSFTAAFVNHIAANPHLQDEANERYITVVSVVGTGGLSDPMRDAVADSFIGYVDRIGYVLGDYMNDTPDYVQADIRAFADELAHSEAAIEKLAAGTTLWAQQRLVPFIESGALPGSSPDEEIGPVAATIASLYGGIFDRHDADAAGISWADGVSVALSIGTAGLFTIPGPGSTTAGILQAGGGTAAQHIINADIRSYFTGNDQDPEQAAREFRTAMRQSLTIGIVNDLYENNSPAIQDLDLDLPEFGSEGSTYDGYAIVYAIEDSGQLTTLSDLDLLITNEIFQSE